VIESWWDAHALEFVLWGVTAGLLAIVWLCISLSEAWRERKQKRKDGLL